MTADDRIAQLEKEVERLKAAAVATAARRPRRVWPWLVILVFAVIGYYGFGLFAELTIGKFSSIGTHITVGS